MTRNISQFGFGIVSGIGVWHDFMMVGKCTMSMYQYDIALNIVLLTYSSFNASILMIRYDWRASCITVFRYAAISAVYTVLGLVLDLQRKRLDKLEWQFYLSRKKLAILLPASCFLALDFCVLYLGSERCVT